MSNNLYFCGVKTQLRYEAAAQKQRFLCPNCIIKNKRIEWGRSNRPEATAVECLTARNALSLLFKTQLL
jgi:hypothetical protein